jgi:hypothetical protein
MGRSRSPLHRESRQDCPNRTWLPTPDGQSYNLTYRFYGPSQDIVSGEWLPPPLTEQK